MSSKNIFDNLNGSFGLPSNSSSRKRKKRSSYVAQVGSGKAPSGDTDFVPLMSARQKKKMKKKKGASGKTVQATDQKKIKNETDGYVVNEAMVEEEEEEIEDLIREANVAAEVENGDDDDDGDDDCEEIIFMKDIGVGGHVEDGVSDAALMTCLQVITLLGKNVGVFQKKRYRTLRKAIYPLQVSQMLKVDDAKMTKLRKKILQDMDDQYRKETEMRAKRLRRLEALNDEQASAATGLNCLTYDEEGAEEVIKKGGEGEEKAKPFVPRVLDGAIETDSEEEETGTSSAAFGKKSVAAEVKYRKLNLPSACYICKKPYTMLHNFYDQLCPECAEFNYMKRKLKANLQGRVALVTGGRVKIGYRCCLKLLRCGATVIVTTRFPKDAAIRFAAEKDCGEWKGNLHIYGMDFRDIAGVEAFCEEIRNKHSYLDMIVNNACQTIRRPPKYYEHMLSTERAALRSFSPTVQSILQSHDSFQARFHGTPQSGASLTAPPSSSPSRSPPKRTGTSSASASTSSSLSSRKIDDNVKSDLSFVGNIEEVVEEDEDDDGGGDDDGALQNEEVYTVHDSDGQQVVGEHSSVSVEMSQLSILPEDKQYEHLFPTGLTDVNNQQVDLRKENSWTSKLAEVSTGEVAEVLAINVMAPTILNSKLKMLLEKSPHQFKFIVNVSAMEGKFYRFKKDTHPHTNMAKAALNMMTRTSAQDYKRSNIYMTSVDTGWINDEKPIQRAVEHMERHGFQTPLDEVDAAARVLDPIIQPLHDLEHGKKNITPFWGIFLKDYVKCEW